MDPIERFLLWPARFHHFPPPRARQERTDSLLAQLCMLHKAGSGLAKEGERIHVLDFAPWLRIERNPAGGQDMMERAAHAYRDALRRQDRGEG